MCIYRIYVLATQGNGPRDQMAGGTPARGEGRPVPALLNVPRKSCTSNSTGVAQGPAAEHVEVSQAQCWVQRVDVMSWGVEWGFSVCPGAEDRGTDLRATGTGVKRSSQPPDREQCQSPRLSPADPSGALKTKTLSVARVSKWIWNTSRRKPQSPHEQRRVVSLAAARLPCVP